MWCDHVELYEKERRAFKLHFPTSRASPSSLASPASPASHIAEQSRRRSLSASPVKVAPRPRLGFSSFQLHPNSLSASNTTLLQYPATTSSGICECEYLLALRKAANVSFRSSASQTSSRRLAHARAYPGCMCSPASRPRGRGPEMRGSSRLASSIPADKGSWATDRPSTDFLY